MVARKDNPLFVTTEKRRFTRYDVKDGMYAALGKNYSRIGKVNDISVNGLAFEFLYNDLVSCSLLSPMTLLLFGLKFQELNLSCKIIYELPSHANANVVAGTLIKKRCGVRFLSLTTNQKEIIDDLISKHATKTAF